MDIKNENGEIIGKIQFQYLEDRSVIDNIVLSLRPGDGKGIYIDNADNHNVTQQTNYEAKKWDGDIKSLIDKIRPWQPCFPTDSIVEIRVYYGFDNLSSEEIDEMIGESKRTGQKVVIRDLKPNNKIVGLNITYQSVKGTYILQIFGTTKSRIQAPNDDQGKIEQLYVRGNKAYYITNLGESHTIWIEEDAKGKALQYEIIGRDLHLENVISITESMV